MQTEFENFSFSHGDDTYIVRCVSSNGRRWISAVDHNFMLDLPHSKTVHAVSASDVSYQTFLSSHTTSTSYAYSLHGAREASAIFLSRNGYDDEFYVSYLAWFDTTVAPWLKSGDTGESSGGVTSTPLVPTGDPLASLALPDFDESIRRCVGPDGKFPWYVIPDVARELGFKSERSIKMRLSSDERGVAQTATPGGKQMLAVVSRPGLLKLCQNSDKAKAKLITRWVNHGVMESVFDTGTYTIPGVAAPSHDPLMQSLESAMAMRREQLQIRQDVQDIRVEQLQLTHQISLANARASEAEARASEANQRAAEAEERAKQTEAQIADNQLRIAEANATASRSHADSLRAVQEAARAVKTVTGEADFFCLVPWAQKHGVYLVPPHDSEEGKVCAAMCRAEGITPGVNRQSRYDVGTYPEHILFRWLDGYRLAHPKGPTLFSG